MLAVGNNKYGQCNVNNLRDIVAVSAGGDLTTALKSDGTVVTLGAGCGCSKLSGWRDIVALSVGVIYTIGLTKSGKVLTAGSNEYGQCKVDGWLNAWRDITTRNVAMNAKK